MADLTIEDLEWLGGRARLSGRHGDADIGVPADKLLALVEIARRTLAPPAAVPGLAFGPWFRATGYSRRDAVATDGCAYWIAETPEADDGPYSWGDILGNFESFDTESEAIAAANAHNAARLKGGE